MNNNKNRIAHFTSSQIYRLCASLKNGKPSSAFYSYIEDVKLEIALCRSINTDINTVPIRWGSLLEVVLFQKKEISLDYRMLHKISIKHDTIPNYSGSPDAIELGKKVAEFKSYYPKNFAALSLCLLKKDTELLKKEFPKEYYQVVSNSILCDVDMAELIVYLPYKDELEKIISDVEETNLLESNNLNASDYYFLTHNDIETLPYLPKESKLKNINRFEFIVPQEDKELLISRVKEAVELLNT